jgi:hypothetical protein
MSNTNKKLTTTQQPELTDITWGPGNHLEILISCEGDRIWINDTSRGVCLVRICRINGILTVNDERRFYADNKNNH